MKNMYQVNNNGATAEFRENDGEAELLLNGEVFVSSDAVAQQAIHSAAHAAMIGFAASAWDTQFSPPKATEFTADGVDYVVTYNVDGTTNTMTANGVVQAAAVYNPDGSLLSFGNNV